MLNHSHYRQTYEEAMKVINEGSSSSKEKISSSNKDDRIHGSLLTINELVLISMAQDPTLKREGFEVEEDAEQDVFKLDSVGEEWFLRQPEMLKLLLQGNTLHSRKADTLSGWSKGCRQLISRHFKDVIAALSHDCRVISVHTCSLFPYQICPAVLKFRASRNPLIQQAVLTLLPRLAAFDPPQFSEL